MQSEESFSGEYSLLRCGNRQEGGGEHFKAEINPRNSM